jgi:hypothetical protein
MDQLQINIPDWKVRQIRRTEKPLPAMTYAAAQDLLARMHKRHDSVRWQLWLSMKEIERLMVRLQMANPNKPQAFISGSRSRKSKYRVSQELFSTQEEQRAA